MNIYKNLFFHIIVIYKFYILRKNHLERKILNVY